MDVGLSGRDEEVAKMLEVVRGHSRRSTAGELETELSRLNVNGTLYLGYPVLASADHTVHIDALLVGEDSGVVAFLIADKVPDSDAEWQTRFEEQDRMYAALETHLGRHEHLRSRRKLAVDPRTVTVFAEPLIEVTNPPEQGDYVGVGQLAGLVETLKPIEKSLVDGVESALQRVTTIKPAKRRSTVTAPNSRGAVIKSIEKEIANLDKWQKHAAIEVPDGPQRIRGLAGSGKTVVLALKAAYLHTQHPDWNIVVTFQTRSLYQQFKDLIRRFTFESLGDEPDWSRLHLMHAWGSLSDRHGVYTKVAQSIGAPVRDWLYGKYNYGFEDAFSGVCTELLSLAKQHEQVSPIFDAVLVDEAQDFPASFFQLVYMFTEHPKRVVWAYDELQQLSGNGMATTGELFGLDSAGHAVVDLKNTDGQPRQDVILPRCYRNPPWTLSLAHSIGFGVNRVGGLVQHFDDATLWSDIGYNVVDGELRDGKRVTLERSPKSYPDFFKELLSPDDCIVSRKFETDEEQLAWLVESIGRDLSEGELEHDDVLVILPDAYTSKKRAQKVIGALARSGIVAHHAGVDTSRDQLFRPGSVAIAHIFRAKGNEAPMVYVLDCEFGTSPQSGVSATGMANRRNVLFTATTRSRAWVRLSGVGDRMERLVAEIEKTRENKFALTFTVPDEEERRKLHQVHRDRSRAEAAQADRGERGLQQFLQAIQSGAITKEELPLEIRDQLRELLG